MVANSRGCCTQCGNVEGKACGEVQGYLNLYKRSLKPSDNDVCARDSSPPTSHVRHKLSSNIFRSSTGSVTRPWYGTLVSSAPLVGKPSPPTTYPLRRRSFTIKYAKNSGIC